MPLIIGGASLVGGALKSLIGGGQKKQGNQVLNQANQLGAFNEQVPTEITNAAATGLPSEQYNQAMQNIQQQQLMAIQGAQSRRAGIGAIAGIQGATNSANLNLDVKNAQAKQQNQNTLASWKDKVWQNNVKSKYNQQYNYGMGLLGAGNQNLVGGIDQGLAGLGSAAYGLYGGSGKNTSLNYSTGTVGNIPSQGFGNQTALTGGGLFGG
jgi:hypothetical protein